VIEHTGQAGVSPALSVTDAALTAPVQLDQGAPGASTVALWDLAPATNIAVWSDATGIWAADLSPTLDSIAPVQVSTDLPDDRLKVTPDGSAVVYYLFADATFYYQALDGSPKVALTNPHAGGDLFASLDITADGERIVYLVDSGGGYTLWTVALDSPLTEQQIDDVGSPLAALVADYALSPDGGRVAWLGDGTGRQIFAAEFADLATVVTLTPATEEPTTAGVWATPMTLAYVSDDSDLGGPSGASALRTVNFASPLITVAHGDDETVGTEARAPVACSDGTLVWVRRDQTGAEDVSTLMSAVPLIAGSELEIAPAANRTLTIPGIVDYACTE
jgi:hypothetical protein